MAPPLLFVFSRGHAEREDAVRRGDAPAEAYGYFVLGDGAGDVAAVDESQVHSRVLRAAGMALQKAYVIPRSGLGYRMHQAVAIWRALRDDPHRVVVASFDSVALPLLRLHASGRLPNPVVMITVGLYDRISSGDVAPDLARRYIGLVRRAHAVLCFTPTEVEAWRRWAPGVRVELLPLGIDSSWWGAVQAERETHVVSSGRDPGRDFQSLVLAARGRPVRIAGDLAAEQGVVAGDGVELLGELPVDALRAEFARAGVVALPIARTNYGSGQTTALQAMAAGCAVVMTDTGWAIAEGLRAGEHYAHVHPGDVAQLRAELDRLLERPEEARELGRRARALVASRCTPQRQAEVIVEVTR